MHHLQEIHIITLGELDLVPCECLIRPVAAGKYQKLKGTRSVSAPAKAAITRSRLVMGFTPSHMFRSAPPNRLQSGAGGSDVRQRKMMLRKDEIHVPAPGSS